MLYPDVNAVLRVILTVFILLLLPSCRSVEPIKDIGDTSIAVFPEVAGADQRTHARPSGDKKQGIPELIKPLSAALPVAVPVAVPAAGLVDGSIEFSDSATTVADTERYSVVADQVPVRDILAALARDVAAEMDFIGDVTGTISLSVIDQPLNYILDQISTLAEVRYEIHDQRILLIEDRPTVRNYEIDYLNMRRHAQSRIDLATQIGSIRTDLDESGGASGGSNGSQLFVENKSVNDIWGSLVRTISGILGEQAETTAIGSENVFVNQESGIITVRARQSQHDSIRELVKRITQSAQRQVLIEATVVEVVLNDNHESGVDWQVLNSQGQSLEFTQLLAGLPNASSATTPVTALFSYSDSGSVLGDLSATLKLLQQFGEVQVLSSPKIIAINNQPAVLKVVDNRVYFTFEVDRLQQENGDERTLVDSTLHSVPVGLVMNVTPFINSDHEVILNVRPTISRILNFAEDPSPALAGYSEVHNLIPEIQVREMESLLRVQSGNVAIIGGLMQNKIDRRTTGVPGLTKLPLLGRMFSHEVRSVEKTELLIFLKPTVLDQKFEGMQ